MYSPSPNLTNENGSPFFSLLKTISKVYGKGIYTRIPINNCYSNIENWYAEIIRNINNVDKIIMSAGFAANIIAKRLWKSNIKKIVLDVGSLSDVFIFHTDIKKRIRTRIFMKLIESKIINNSRILLRNI